MAKIVSFSIYKGGTGKTTSAVNTAAALVELGNRVLLIDLDQQAQSTRYLGVDPDTVSVSVANTYIQHLPLSSAIQKTAFGIDLAPGSALLSAVDAMLEEGKDDQILSQKLAAVIPDYDVILIDTPPGKSKLTFNAIVAAQRVIVPVTCEKSGIDGLADLIKHLHTTLWPRYGLDQDIKILFTKYKSSTSLSPGIVSSATKIYRDNVLSMHVPDAIIFPRSYAAQQPMTKFAPSHVGTKVYKQLAQWLLQ